MKQLLEKAKEIFLQNKEAKIPNLLNKIRMEQFSGNLIKEPFRMSVGRVSDILGCGIMASGCVEQGVLRLGDDLEILGMKDPKKTLCQGIEYSKALCDKAEVGQEVRIFLRSVELIDVKVGQVIAHRGKFQTYNKFYADCYFFKVEEIGYEVTLDAISRVRIVFGTLDILAEMRIANEGRKIKSGDYLSTKIELLYPMVLSEDTVFFIMDNKCIVGIGIVSATN